MNDETFRSVIERLRQGDESAAAEIVAEFESEIRRFIRFRLTSPRIRRMIESVDISQSVFARFFVDVQRREGGPATVEELRALLLTMARNRLLDHARRQNAEKRRPRRPLSYEYETLAQIVDGGTDTPSQQLIQTELVQAVKDLMDPEELELVNARMSGQSWEELAQARGGTAESVRKRVARILERTAKQLESHRD